MKNSLLEKVQIFLFFIYVLLFYMFGADPQKVKYSEIVLLVFCFIEIINMLRNKKMKIEKHIIVIVTFCVYCFFSVIWAIDKDVAFSRGITMLSLALFIVIAFNFFTHIDNNIDYLLRILLFSGFIFSVYIVMYYGVNNYFNMLLSGLRIGEEINNVNTLGLQLSISVLIAIYYGLNYSKKYYMFSILPIIVSLGTASRKVIILLVLGSILLVLLQNHSRDFLSNALKKILMLLCLFFVFYYISQLDAFSLIAKRFEQFFNLYTGSGKIDQSTLIRKLFIEAGFKQFLQTPFLGIGIGNSYIITLAIANWSTYLHNNFVELLSTTGIIGFSLYYYSFLSIIKNCANYIKNKFSNLVIVIFSLCIVLDWGTVSYYSKSTYIYLLIGILLYFNNNQHNGVILD